MKRFSVVLILGSSVLIGGWSVAGAGGTTPTFSSDPASVPDLALRSGVAQLNAFLCDSGAVADVQAVGSTTARDLPSLLPSLPAIDSVIGDSSPGSPFYAAVTTGSCEYERGDASFEVAVEGYVLFDANGLARYYRVWRSGFEPKLQTAFGPEANAALNI